MLHKFLSFDEMVTPFIIHILYWIIIALVVVGVIISLFHGFGQFIVGLIGGAIGIIFWRVTCELILVLFRIHGQLGEISRNTAATSSHT